MPHSLAKLLLDVEMAIGLIRDFTAGVTRDRFGRDPMVKSAVQMQFVIIGEALVRVRDAFPDAFASVSGGQRIIDFRNIIAHGYDIVSDDLVWDVIQNHLATLYDEVTALRGRP